MPLGGAALGAGIGAVGSLIGSGKQADAIKSAANTQAQAADYAANLSSQAENNSLDFTKGVYSNAQSDESPYEQAGAQALGTLSSGLQKGGEFNSTPTSDQILADDPGYQFRMDQGNLALNRAEAAGGNAGSGGALEAAEQYGQNFASGEFQNAYQRYETNRQDNYNDLAGMVSTGLTANAGENSAGSGAAANVSNTALTGANQQGNYATQGANATAAGAVGVANAGASAISSIGTNLQQLLSQNPSLLSSGSRSGYGTMNFGGASTSLANMGASPYTGGYTDSSGNFVVTQ